MQHEPAYLSWVVTEQHRTQAAALNEHDFPEARELLLSWQDGRCALCGRPDRLVVDHDHQTALVRSLLCQRCNGVEGRASRWSPPAWIARYRSHPPAALLGLHVVYHDLYGPVAPEPALLDPRSEETQNALEALFAGLSAAKENE